MHSRIVLAVLTGTGATLAILFVMSALIEFGPTVLSEPRERDALNFIREVREEPPPVEEPPPARLPEPPTIPESPAPSTESAAAPIRVALAAPEPATTYDGTVALAVNDGPLVAVLRVQPNYPSRAAIEGLEGHVVVEFTVLPDGSTAGHRVIESSHRIFESAAIRAAERFRFRPRVLEGVPVATHGVRNLFRFEMEQH